jgi:hypothetical protein
MEKTSAQLRAELEANRIANAAPETKHHEAKADAVQRESKMQPAAPTPPPPGKRHPKPPKPPRFGITQICSKSTPVETAALLKKFSEEHPK